MSLRTTTQTLLAQARTLRPANLTPVISRSATPATAPTGPLNLTTVRQYRPTADLLSYKDDQDRQSLKPRPSEGTKSGSDDEVAEKTDAAFNPAKTSPEAEKDSAARASNGNPLEASGANQELSRPQGASEEVADKEDKKTRSGGTGGKGGKKHGKVKPM